MQLSNLPDGTTTCGAEHLNDLIYSFLLQSDYPRASIVFDIDMLGSTAQADSGTVTTLPAFVIVDPDNTDILSVIEVVDAVNGDTLRQIAIETGAYASQLGGKSVQGFVIRVDVHGKTEAEQIQFYRIWPNSTLQQLNSKTFPDLSTLRVAKKLATVSAPQEPAPTPAVEPEIIDLIDDDEDFIESKPGFGMYLPALVLILLGLVDGYFTVIKGAPLLSVPQSVLAFGAAILFTLPAAIRFLRSRE